jgi:hypothetical protein
MWYCCMCRDGPIGGWQPQCPTCDHVRGNQGGTRLNSTKTSSPSSLRTFPQNEAFTTQPAHSRTVTQPIPSSTATQPASSWKVTQLAPSRAASQPVSREVEDFLESITTFSEHMDDSDSEGTSPNEIVSGETGGSQELDSRIETYQAPRRATPESAPFQDQEKRACANVESSFKSNTFTNLKELLLPHGLLQELLPIPRESIVFDATERNTLLSTMKGFLENATALEWDWWPMSPRMRPLKPGETRVHWLCVGPLHPLGAQY